MTKSLLALIMAAAAAAVITTVSAGGATGAGEIRITDVESLHTVSRAHPGTKAGTVETLTQRLYNPRLSAKPIGRGVVVCTWVDSRDRSCVATYVLPKGSIVAAGALQTRLLYELPIVGGTGIYSDARGSLTVTASHFKPRHEVLVFRLVG